MIGCQKLKKKKKNSNLPAKLILDVLRGEQQWLQLKHYNALHQERSVQNPWRNARDEADAA